MDTVIQTIDTAGIIAIVKIAMNEANTATVANTASSGLSTDAVTILVTLLTAFVVGFLTIMLFMYKMNDKLSERISKLETRVEVLTTKFDDNKLKTEKIEHEVKEFAIIKENSKKIETLENDVKEIKTNFFNLIEKMVDNSKSTVLTTNH